MGELQKIVPGLLSELTAQARLHFLPDGLGAIELGLSGAGEAQASFAAVFAAALCEPALAAHDGEGASEAGAVHGQHFAELSLGDFAGPREDLQDGELGSAQPERTEGRFVEVGECAGGAAEVGAHAGERW